MDNEIRKILDLRLAKGEISLEEYHAIEERISNDKIGANCKSNNQTNTSSIFVSVEGIFNVHADMFLYKNKTYQYKQVVSITFSSFQLKVNLLPIKTLTNFIIILDDGEVIRFNLDKMFRCQLSKQLEVAYNFISKRTFESRMTRIMHSIHKLRQIPIPSKPEAFIDFDGVVHCKGVTLSLNECSKYGRVSLGTDYKLGLNRSADPNEIEIYDKDRLFGAKKIVFTLTSDQDAWKSLLGWFMKDGKTLR